jgi:adenylate cyclase
MNPGGGWWGTHRARLLRLWAVGVGASVLVTAASALGYLESVQAKALDAFLALRTQPLPGGIVVVAIDDDAFAALGRGQPISRAYVARLVDGLRRSGAAVVGLDLALTTPTSPNEDAALARAVLNFGEDGVSRVVMAHTGDPPAGPLGDSALMRAVVRGSPRVPWDRDGVIRRAALLVPEGASREPAFSLAIVARLAGMNAGELDEFARRAPEQVLRLPRWHTDGSLGADGPDPLIIRPDELLRINFVGPARSFLTIPSEAIAPLGYPGTEIASDNPLHGRIVLIGGTFAESQEIYHTPHGPMPGVEVHANLVHMLVTRRFIRPAAWGWGLGLQVALVLLTGVALVVLRPAAGALVSMAGALGVAAPASYLLFSHSGVWVDFLVPVLTTCCMAVVTDVLARRRLRESFGRYVSREVMARVLADATSLRGERRQVSILFSDLRGFTTLAEGMAAETVAAHLSQYFDAMTEAILAHRGMINDFVGDAIMATFGAPVGDPEHALHAIQSAVAMDRALHELNRRWEAEGRPILRMGVAVHTGEVFAGNVGGSARLKYAVVGDPVNVAARLEGLNKELGTTLLITEATRVALGDRVDTKDRGTIGLRGRTEPLRVYEVLGVSAGHTPSSDRAGASTPEVLDAAGHGAGKRRLTMWGRLGVVGTVGLLLWAGAAWAAEPVAVLTEIRPASGNVRVKLAADAEWKVPQPLMSLSPGDQVRVLGDGQAVLVLRGGQGAQIVSQANSPFTVQLPARQTGGDRVQSILWRVTDVLTAQPRETTYRPLWVRTVSSLPVIVSPRQTKLLPGPVRFVWSGSDQLRYGVRVIGPRGLLWEQSDLRHPPYDYPNSAPRLEAGVEYGWELEATGHPSQHTRFQVLSLSDADRIRADLATLQSDVLSGYPPTTLIVMRVGVLLTEGLYDEAWRELVARIATDPREPTLHQLIGHVYQRTGRADLAAQAFAEAEFLTARAP